MSDDNSAELDLLLEELKGPHDVEAAKQIAEKALGIEMDQRQTLYHWVFAEGFRAGYAACQNVNKGTGE